MEALNNLGSRCPLPCSLHLWVLIPAEDSLLLQELLRCCESKTWAGQMIAQRPFIDLPDMLAKSDKAWATVTREDILEAS